MSDQARRDNKGKIDLTMLPVKALEQESLVWMAGEQKYGRDNWKKLWGDRTIDVVMASLLRHSLRILEGESRDSETNLYHAAHIRANAAMLIEWYEREHKSEPTIEQDSSVKLYEFHYSYTDLDGTRRYVYEILTEKQITEYLKNSDIKCEQIKTTGVKS